MRRVLSLPGPQRVRRLISCSGNDSCAGEFTSLEELRKSVGHDEELVVCEPNDVVARPRLFIDHDPRVRIEDPHLSANRTVGRPLERGKHLVDLHPGSRHRKECRLVASINRATGDHVTLVVAVALDRDGFPPLDTGKPGFSKSRDEAIRGDEVLRADTWAAYDITALASWFLPPTGFGREATRASARGTCRMHGISAPPRRSRRSGRRMPLGPPPTGALRPRSSRRGPVLPDHQSRTSSSP